MADQAQLELVITAQTDRVLAGLSSFEKSLNTIGAAHQAAGVAAAQHTSQIEILSGKLTNLVNIGNLFIAWQVASQALSMFSGLEKFNIDLLRTTEILGGNATAASTWAAAANIMGISLDTIDRGFAKLSTDLNSSGNPALKQMGIAAEDASGRLRPLSDVISQAADYFRAHAGAANNAALANQLFGRSGYELLPILEQGRAGLQAITDEARKYGLILDASTIERNAAFTFQLKEAQLAASGLASSVGNALLPGLAAMAQGLSKLIEDNLPAFVAGINRAISYVIGFIQAVTGMTMTVDQGAATFANMSGIVGDTGTGLDKATSAAGANAAAMKAITEAAKDATAALDDQIRALTAQQAATKFEDTQTALRQKSEDERVNIAKLAEDKKLALFLGNAVQAMRIDEQLTAAREQNAATQLSLTRGVEDEATKLKVAALEAQKRSIADAAASQVAAMQAAASATTAGFAASAATIPPVYDAAFQQAMARAHFVTDQAAGEIGKSMGGKLMDAMFGPEVWVGLPDRASGHLERTGGQGFTAIGKAIGEAIATGLTTAMGQGMADWWNNQVNHWFSNLQKGLPAFMGGEGGSVQPIPGLKYDRGGMVPGPIGMPQIAVVHGGEQVSTPAQQAAGGSSRDFAQMLALAQRQLDVLQRMLAEMSGSASAGTYSGFQVP